MDPRTIALLAGEIHAAEGSATPREPLSERYPQLTAASAYAVQESYARLRVDGGATLTGRKIGCTSKAIQDFFGIDTPDFGHLFDDMLVPDGGEISVGELISPMVEPELAFILGADVDGPGVTQHDILEVTDAVLPALEIIDSRISDWRVKFVDTVADNGSSARYVLGPAMPFDGSLDLAAEHVLLRENGNEVDTGVGAAVLGHPAASVAWLANALSEYGAGLRAGDHVLSGSMTRAVAVKPDLTYEARFDTFGTVSCRFR